MTDRDRKDLSLFTYSAPSRVRVSRRRRGMKWFTRTVWAVSFIAIVALLGAPWRQNVTGAGRVIAYAPTDRTQSIEAPLKGRIVAWHVQEGSNVVAGDPIVDIADNDPFYVQRLEREQEAAQQRITAARNAIAMSEMTIASLEAARDGAVSNAELYVLIATDKRAQAEQELQAAEAALKTALLNHGRQSDLGSEGLASTRKVELADLKLATTRSKRDAAKAKLRAATKEISAAKAKLDNTSNKEGAAIAKAKEALEKQRAELAKARAELAKTDVKVSRQQSMGVVAPVTGTVLKLMANGPGEFVKPGDVVARIVPDTSSRAVELWVEGNDMPLVTPGRKVRLQFEGWPAVQFVGWPSIAVGTFGGVVSFVDATDDGRGRFRVVVAPDPDDEPWPEQRFLRQGVRANGWLLLDEVTVAFELWRQLNGFPPSVAPPKEGAGTGGGKEKGK
jgi:multidrug efflux pump subunit AcrA (membrane-fusion protein)